VKHRVDKSRRSGWRRTAWSLTVLTACCSSDNGLAPNGEAEASESGRDGSVLDRDGSRAADAGSGGSANTTDDADGMTLGTIADGAAGSAGQDGAPSAPYAYCDDPATYKLPYDVLGTASLAQTLQSDLVNLSIKEGFALVVVNGSALKEPDLLTLAKIKQPTAQGGAGLTKLQSLGLCNVETLNTAAFRSLGTTWLRYLYLDSLEAVLPDTFGGADGALNTSLYGVSLQRATAIGAAAFAYGSLKSLVLPNAVTIGDNAFRDNHQMLQVDLPRATTLGEYAFDDCTHLVKARFPEVTTVGRNAFDDNHALVDIALPKATYIGKNVFGSDFGLQAIDLPAAVKIDDNAFDNCEALSSVHLPEVVEIRNQVFRRCVALKSIALPKAKFLYHDVFNFCTEAIQPVPGACCALERVDLPVAEQLGWYAFGGCAKLTEVNVPKVKVVYHHAFQGNSSLARLLLPSVTDLREAAFEGTTSLDSVVLGAKPPIVTNAADRAFAGTRDNLAVYHSGNTADWSGFALSGNASARLVSCSAAPSVCVP